MAQWWEDESLWRECYPFIFTDDMFLRASQQVEQVHSLAGIQTGRLLDLGCGPGRHSLAFARKGWKVTGVDRSTFLLDIAKERAETNGVEVDFVHDDIRSFVRSNTFDLVVNLFTSFGYFDDPADDLRVVRNIYASLRSGGTVVIDVMGRESFLLRGLHETVAQELPDGSLRIERNQFTDDWSALKGRWFVIRDQTVKMFEIRLRIYSGRELSDLLKEAGFASVVLFGDLDGRSFGRTTNRLVAVARKD